MQGSDLQFRGKSLMARMKLHIPDTFVFETELTLRVSDMNYGDHLGNDTVLSLMHEARVQFFRSLGYTELDVEGVGIIMSDAHLVFRSEGFYGDRITIRLAPATPEGVRFDMYYQLVNAVTGKEVARARTEISFFDYATRKTVPVPEPFRIKLGNV